MAKPLRIAALVKQIPKIEALTLGADGRLQRDGVELHMNDYCRRAVAKGHRLAPASGCPPTVTPPPSPHPALSFLRPSGPASPLTGPGSPF